MEALNATKHTTQTSPINIWREESTSAISQRCVSRCCCCWNHYIVPCTNGAHLATASYVAPSPNHVQHNVHEQSVSQCIKSPCVSRCFATSLTLGSLDKRSEKAAPLPVESLKGLEQDLRREWDEATRAICRLGKEEGRQSQGTVMQGNVQRLFEPKRCIAVVVQVLLIIIPHGPQDSLARKIGCKPTTSFVHSILPIGRWCQTSNVLLAFRYLSRRRARLHHSEEERPCGLAFRSFRGFQGVRASLACASRERSPTQSLSVNLWCWFSCAMSQYLRASTKWKEI